MDMREQDRRALRQMFTPSQEANSQPEGSVQEPPKYTVAFTRTLLLQLDADSLSPSEVETWAEEQMEQLRSRNFTDATVKYTIVPRNEAARRLLEQRTQEVASRYVTTANVDDTEGEIPFVGLPGLLALIDEEQCSRRGNEAEPLSSVQVTIWNEEEATFPWQKRTRLFVCYDLYGSDLGGIREKSEDEGLENILAVLGLPA